MNKSYKVVVGVITSVGLGLAVASAYANPQGMGRHTQGAMQHGMKGAMGPGAMGHGAAGQGAELAGVTPEERTSLQEKMRNAKTPEERQKIAAATRTEMQKRAQANGATHPEHRGPGIGMGHSRGNTN